jgi:hypothetical protein
MNQDTKDRITKVVGHIHAPVVLDIIEQSNAIEEKFKGKTDLWLLHHLFWHKEVDDYDDIVVELKRRGFKLKEGDHDG